MNSFQPEQQASHRNDCEQDWPRNQKQTHPIVTCPYGPALNSDQCMGQALPPARAWTRRGQAGLIWAKLRACPTDMHAFFF